MRYRVATITFPNQKTMPEITEKELSANQKPLWLKALSAAQSANLDYSIAILQSILKDSPGFLKGRELLRQCEIKKLAGGKKKGLFTLQSGNMKLQSQAKKDPQGALPLIEKELEKDPLSDQLNDLLFEVCQKVDLPETAAFALETIRKNAPENAKLLHKLAEYYVTQEQPQKAAEVYNTIIEHHPTDGKAIKGAKDCSARASMQKAKWDENASMKDLMRNKDEFEELEKASRTGLTREQLEARRDQAVERYNENPNHLPSVKDLANIYEQLEDWTNAQAFFEWAHSLSNGDTALSKKAAEMKDKAEELELRNLEAALAADPDNAELQAALAERRASRIQDQVVEATRRVEQNPTDPHLRYELGKALYDSGDHSAAIPHLQQATRNPHIRTKVLLLLGRTFKAKNMYDIAIKQLADALADLVAMDNTKKEILYEKGIIHTEMGDKDAALDCFKQIYEVDYGYRDVAQRVESSY